MPVIPIQNGTHSITIECASLTNLEYSEDDNIYRCEFSDWAFGLFALLTVLVMLVPVIITIHCWIKWYHKQQTKHFRPNLSRQTSYSSLYHTDAPNRNMENVIAQQPDVVYHNPQKRKGKAYFPYPAYGTYDINSLPGSTASLYIDQVNINRENVDSTQTQEIPTKQSNSYSQNPSFLSSSAPVVTSMLRDYRENLHNTQKAQKDIIEPFNSLDGKKNGSQNILYPGKNDTDLYQKRLKSNPGTTISTSGTGASFSASTISSDTATRSILDEFIVENDNGDENDGINKNFKPIATIDNKLNAAQCILSKNRILTATPPKNMVTRQDFDDYLADCVLRLPEDQRNGTFLIRNSTTVSDCKVLTLYSKSLENNASLYYFKIYYNDDRTLFLENSSETFGTIDAFINYHRDNRSILPCLLAECLGRNF